MRDFKLDMGISINIQNVKDLIHSDNFAQFLLNNTTDFGVVAFILQTIEDKIRIIEQLEDEE